VLCAVLHNVPGAFAGRSLCLVQQPVDLTLHAFTRHSAPIMSLAT
jgi:hypothetical protein